MPRGEGKRRKNGTFKKKFVYTEEIAKKIYHMSKRGMSQEHIGGSFGLSVEGFHKIIKRYPPIKNAIVGGRAFGVNFATKIMWSKIKKGDTTMVRFYLSTKGDYNPKQTVAIGTDTNNDKPISLKIDTTDVLEAAKLYAKFMTEK